MPVKNVIRVAALLRLFTTLCLIGLPLVLLVGLAKGSFGAEAIVAAHPGLPAGTAPDEAAVVLYIGIEVILLCALGYVLWQVRALFGGYACGDILTVESAGHITRAARGLLTLAALGVLTQPLQVLILTLGNAPGQRQISLALSDAEIGTVLAGGVLWVVGWALAEAARIAEENREFV